MSKRDGGRKRDGRSRGVMPARIHCLPLKVTRVFDGKMAWRGRARAQPLARLSGQDASGCVIL